MLNRNLAQAKKETPKQRRRSLAHNEELVMDRNVKRWVKLLLIFVILVSMNQVLADV